MLKSLVISLIIITTTFILGYYYIASPEVVFDKEVVQYKVSENTRVVGYRVNKGGATVPFYYYYFFLSSSQAPGKNSPFMITSANNIEIKHQEEGRIQINMQGEILSFKNEVWTQVDDEFHSLKIDINARYQ
ncbi:hypothetical protein [Endozoicomonas sp. Mp262]|uniref:hypothetical protein n=1 Tax=Endozoicomonas sp. Mp262 TaxID=2919499 RepID=UPI0021DB1463